MKKKINDDDYIPSYVEKRLINPTEVNWGDQKVKNKKKTVVTLLILLLLAVTGVYFRHEINFFLGVFKVVDNPQVANISIDDSPFSSNVSPLTNEVKEMQNFNDLAKYFETSLSDLLDSCTTNYNNDDFSNNSKDMIRNKINTINSISFDSYDSSKFGLYFSHQNKLKEITLKYADFFINCYENNPSNTKVAKNMIDEYNIELSKSNDIFIEVLKNNKFQYSIEDDSKIIYWK